MERKILHIDMDAFFAAVEILDRPELATVPLVVGGSPNSRAVVCAASYPARTYGIRSAMPCSMAYRKCPHAVFVPPRFHRYREVSNQVFEIFRRYTDLIEPLSLDEAWLDVTVNYEQNPSATRIAEAIREAVRREVGITCSAGVSYNKFLAKIASDERKPDGLFVITPQAASEFLSTLPVRKIPGVGPVMLKRLEEHEIRLGRDLLAVAEQDLMRWFGKMGGYLYRIIRGRDERPVQPHRERKSLGIENTFATDLPYGEELRAELEDLLSGLDKRWRAKEDLVRTPPRTVTLKVKFFDFRQVTRSETRAESPWTLPEVSEAARRKLHEVCTAEFPGIPIRLLGVSLSGFDDDGNPDQRKPGGPEQLDLWPWLFPEG